MHVQWADGYRVLDQAKDCVVLAHGAPRLLPGARGIVSIGEVSLDDVFELLWQGLSDLEVQSDLARVALSVRPVAKMRARKPQHYWPQYARGRWTSRVALSGPIRIDESRHPRFWSHVGRVPITRMVRDALAVVKRYDPYADRDPIRVEVSVRKLAISYKTVKRRLEADMATLQDRWYRWADEPTDLAIVKHVRRGNSWLQVLLIFRGDVGIDETSLISRIDAASVYEDPPGRLLVIHDHRPVMPMHRYMTADLYYQLLVRHYGALTDSEWRQIVLTSPAERRRYAESLPPLRIILADSGEEGGQLPEIAGDRLHS